VDYLSHVGGAKLNYEMSLEIGQLGVCDEFRKVQSYCKCVFNVFQSHDCNVFTTESEAVETSIDIIHNSVIELTPNVLFYPTEVRNTIRSLRLTKAAGPDQINNRFLKTLP
jgi:hypothetical protein